MYLFGVGVRVLITFAVGVRVLIAFDDTSE